MPRQDFDTDIAVIGVGTAGLSAFDEILRCGKAAIVVDHGPLGTMCARVGCMPSKAALHAGARAATMRRLAGDCVVDDLLRQQLWADVRAFRDRMAGGAADSTREKLGERLVCGRARFVDAQTIDVDGRPIRARAFVVAVGSAPVVPKPFAALGELALTTDSLFELATLPHSLGVIGAGAIGIEMGLALARLGLEVTVGDQAKAVAGIADEEVSSRAAERFGQEVRLWLGEEVRASREGDHVRMSSGTNHVLVDRLLVAVGRAPSLAALALDNAGVKLDPRGRVDIDPASLRCGETTVFVAGDASDDRPLLHEAKDEGAIAARHAAAFVDGRTAPPIERRTKLSIVFSDPDIGSIGVALRDLDPATTVVGTAKGSDNGRSILLGEESSLIRLYADRNDGRLRGATVFCAGGEHIAHLLAWAVQRGDTLATLLQLPYYHPTVEEAVLSALRDAAEQLSDPPDCRGLHERPRMGEATG